MILSVSLCSPRRSLYILVIIFSPLISPKLAEYGIKKTKNKTKQQQQQQQKTTKKTKLSLHQTDPILPLDGTHLVAVRGLITKRYSTQERQREEPVGAALLRPIRTNGSSLTCRCQFPDSR